MGCLFRSKPENDLKGIVLSRSSDCFDGHGDGSERAVVILSNKDGVAPGGLTLGLMNTVSGGGKPWLVMANKI